MAKVKNKRNAGMADRVQNKKKANASKKTLNPFEVHINREKLKVLGKKSKHDRGLPGVSRAKAIQKRKETLGTEMKVMNKTNTFIDRRIGEKNNQISTEDRMVARFAAERAKQHSKKSIYNLADDEILTHRGQTLEQIEKFDDPRSSDDEDEEKKFGGLGNDFVSEGHFGGGVLSKSESKDGAKSHKDLIEQLIAESKKRKAEKQKEKEHTLDLTEKLDSEWKDLQPVVFKCQKEKEESLIDKLLSKEEKGQDYDKMMRELRFEKRGTPSDGLKSKEKQEEEERKKIEEMERQRQQRMFSEEELAISKAPTSKHRSADDLDDNFELDNTQDFMLAYDKDGKPLVPEHILKDFSVPNAKKKFEDGVSDSSGDEAETESGDESDDEEGDQENDDNSDNDESSKKAELGLEDSDDGSSGDDSGEISKKNIKNKTNQNKSNDSRNKIQTNHKDNDDDSSRGDESDEISSKGLKMNVIENKCIKETDSETSDDESDTKQNTTANDKIKVIITENNSDPSINNKSKKVTPNKKDNLKRKQSESDEESESISEVEFEGFSENQIKSDIKKPKLLNPEYFHSKNDASNIETQVESCKKKSTLLYPDYFPPKNDDNTPKMEAGSDKNKSKLLYPDYFPPKNDNKISGNEKTMAKNDKKNSVDEENDSQSSEEEDSNIDQFKDLKETDESNDELDDCSERIGSFFDFKSAEGANLKELLSGKTPAQQSAALDKLIKSYDPSLGESNKEHLSRLYAHLLQYTHDLFSNLKTESDIIKSFLVLNKIVPYFYDLIHLNKVSTKKFLVELLKEKHDQFKHKPKKIPDLDTLVFFKLVSILYPTSDFRHPVTTPSLIFMTEILSLSRFRDAYSVSRGFFIVSLILEYIVLSKRYVPEALNFLRGIFYLCANTSVLNPVQIVPPFRLHRDVKILNLEHDCSEMAVEEKMAAKDLLRTEIDDSYKIRCLLTSTLMLKEFFDNYNDFEALAAIFEPHIQLLDRVDLELYPSKVSGKVSEVLQYMKQTLEVKTYTQMAREKVRPKALRLYEPDIQDVFTGSKSSNMSRENADRARLKGKYKREMKGALREIRRDKAYIASVKIRQKIQSDNIRKEKVKQIYKDASIQQGELNKLKRGK
ncbi:nucleolar protein 14 homolog [Maniola jurtina]|uniref:nucleolar protein 14 homolog n=1 Tax=Maniola jurtina TaxID=191418 RepID=UPI001E68FC4F|nr:nucleolar protein 14 homolog [Maniola jurtina]